MSNLQLRTSSIILTVVLALAIQSHFCLTTAFTRNFRLANNNKYTQNKNILYFPPQSLNSFTGSNQVSLQKFNMTSDVTIETAGIPTITEISKIPQPLDEQDHEETIGKISFSHVHMYVDNIDEFFVYEKLAKQLDKLAETMKDDEYQSIDSKQRLWNRIISTWHKKEDKVYRNIKKPKIELLEKDGIDITKTPTFITQNRDIIKQLMVGFGFRVTGIRYHDGDDDGEQCQTRTVLVTSRDPSGIKYLITSASSPRNMDSTSKIKEMHSPTSTYDVLHADNVHKFYNAHTQHQGVGVLAFLVENANSIYQRYQKFHPNLIAAKYPSRNKAIQVLEVYAFYKDDNHVACQHAVESQQKTQDTQQTTAKQADTGTILRFIEWDQTQEGSDHTFIHDILGLKKVNASFVDRTSQAAYCDHWVSNVYNRNEFLKTLHDTLQFTTKVDFNAGVVAAGEAQIESTVTGNDLAPTFLLSDQELNQDDMASIVNTMLKDQNQVYLPINNALSEVGHVYYFLKQLGQGIQHIASRVSNLISFVQRCNEFREITNEGFSFLRIPRSYYGVLSIQQLTANDDNPLLSDECAFAIIAKLRHAGFLSKDNAIHLHLTRDDIALALDSNIENDVYKSEYLSKKDIVLDIIMKSRYCNLYSLLRDQIAEEQYIGIVKNQILVDVQGNDLLYQIFTSNILQRTSTDEAPFLEFIQRVCSSKSKVLKPGCGGFGIRNFLTLFLSIEVSKAMQEVADAMEAGDIKKQEYAQEMVDCFTTQLNESNPILTFIADAMTDEGKYKELMAKSYQENDLEEASNWETKMNEASLRKKEGNLNLMACSTKYMDKMKSIREARQNALLL